jgi:nucleoside-diphosphate-sugar epimerase
MKVLITGSGGLIGSSSARKLASQGWDVVGVDNNMRQEFFASKVRQLTSLPICLPPSLGTDITQSISVTAAG